MSPGIGNVITDGGGVGVGGTGAPTGPVGTKGSGPTDSIGTGPGKGKPPPGKGTSSAAERSVIAIPPAIQQTTSPYESEVYAEADFYALFTPDLRASVSVPANEVCVDGDILRTHERRFLTHRITDISKCRYGDKGDDQESMHCPPEAHTTVVAYNNYSLLTRQIQRQHVLRLRQIQLLHQHADDGPEQEICRVQGKYEGIWGTDTMFHYPRNRRVTCSAILFSMKFALFRESNSRRAHAAQSAPP